MATYYYKDYCKILTVARQPTGSAECLATSIRSTEEHDHLSVA